MNVECFDCENLEECKKKEANTHHYGHELRSYDIVREFLDDHRFSSEVNRFAPIFARLHMRAHMIEKMRPLKVIKFVKSIPAKYRDMFIACHNCDHEISPYRLKLFRSAIFIIENTRFSKEEMERVKDKEAYVNKILCNNYKYILSITD